MNDCIPFLQVPSSLSVFYNKDITNESMHLCGLCYIQYAIYLLSPCPDVHLLFQFPEGEY